MRLNRAGEMIEHHREVEAYRWLGDGVPRYVGLLIYGAVESAS